MNKAHKTVSKITAIFATAMLVFATIAYAQDVDQKFGKFNITDSNTTLAYAAPTKLAKRTHPEINFTEEAFEHELNDAWLGMPATAKNGKIIGTVIDAYLDANGDVSELLIALDASSLNYAVYVDSKFAELNDIDVKINLSANQIALLEREESNSATADLTGQR